MPALIVKLPRDRNFCGEIRLIDAAGAVLAGPFAIAGRAADAPARAAGNAARSPLQRFGDTPTGRYKIRDVLPSGAGTAFRSADYGGSGIIVLDPRDGDAALAEANGRFHIFIQGGAMADGMLCATNGALRMRNEDLAVICALLGAPDGTECWCVEDAAMAGAAVMADNDYEEGDPPPLIKRPSARQDLSRRRMLAGAALASSPLPVLLPGIFVAAAPVAPALAQTAYDNDNSGNDGQGSGADSGQDNGQDNGQNNDGQDNGQDNNGQNGNGDDNSTPKAY